MSGKGRILQPEYLGGRIRQRKPVWENKKQNFFRI